MRTLQTDETICTKGIQNSQESQDSQEVMVKGLERSDVVRLQGSGGFLSLIQGQ